MITITRSAAGWPRYDASEYSRPVTAASDDIAAATAPGTAA
jgi:hypothetical protein